MSSLKPSIAPVKLGQSLLHPTAVITSHGEEHMSIGDVELLAEKGYRLVPVLCNTLINGDERTITFGPKSILHVNVVEE